MKNCLGNLRNEVKNIEIELIQLKNQKHSVSTQKKDELRNPQSRARASNAIERRIEALSKLEDEYTRKITEGQGKLDLLLNFEAQAVFHINKLEKVSPSLFIRSYKGDDVASEEATNYLMGIFPEWRRTPEWFKALTDRYEQGRGTKIGN